MDKVVGKITNHPCPVGTGDKELFFFSVRSQLKPVRNIKLENDITYIRESDRERERGEYTDGATHGELKIRKKH